MILDRERENKNHGKEAQLSQFPDDLCGKLKKLNLRGSQASENTNNFSKMKNKLKMKHNSEDNAISNIGELISNIKIVDDKDPSEKQKENIPSQVLNIVCDSKIEEQNACKHDSNVNSDTEQDLPSDKEKNIVEIGAEEKCVEEKDSHKNESDSSSLINEGKEAEQKDTESENEKADVSKKTDDVLCSRGPVPQKFCQQQFQPYNTCSRSHHSGGKVRVAEPVIQPPANNFQQKVWNDIPNLNFLPTGQEQCTPPVQTSYLPVAQEQANNSNISEEQTCELMFNMLSQNEVIQGCCALLNSGSNNLPNSYATRKEQLEQIYQNLQDEGLPSSPSISEKSPPGSPHGSFLRPPARSDGSDSGLESPTHVMEDYTRDHPLQTFMSRNDTVVNGPERTETWVLDHAQEVHTQKPLRPLLPKPEIPSAKTKFQHTLNQDWKFRAWAKVQTLSDTDFKTKDVDGDTQLMIVVSNEFDGQLELIYAMVERMRRIRHSLDILNKAGHSALYLACKLLPEQPLVAAYIAEALLEQDVDVVNTTYESDLTLPEILKNEGDSHIAVLKELLALKDSRGKFVFQSYQNDVNGNI